MKKRFSNDLNEISFCYYKETPAVKKIFKKEGERRFYNELNAFNFYHETGIVPNILSFSIKDKTIIMEKIKGDTLWDKIKCEDFIDFSKIHNVLKLMERKSIPFPWKDLNENLFFYLDSLKKQIFENNEKRFFAKFITERGMSDLDKIISFSREYLLKKSKSYNSKYVNLILAHGDFKTSNILEESDSLKLIDWEFSHFNNIYLDISQLAYPNSRFDSENFIKSFDKENFNFFLYDFFNGYNCIRIPLSMLNMYEKYNLDNSNFYLKKKIIKERIRFLEEDLLSEQMF